MLGFSLVPIVCFDMYPGVFSRRECTYLWFKQPAFQQPRVSDVLLQGPTVFRGLLSWCVLEQSTYLLALLRYIFLEKLVLSWNLKCTHIPHLTMCSFLFPSGVVVWLSLLLCILLCRLVDVPFCPSMWVDSCSYVNAPYTYIYLGDRGVANDLLLCVDARCMYICSKSLLAWLYARYMFITTLINLLFKFKYRSCMPPLPLIAAEKIKRRDPHSHTGIACPSMKTVRSNHPNRWKCLIRISSSVFVLHFEL